MAESTSLPSLRREVVQRLGVIGVVWTLVVFLAITWVAKREVDELMDATLQESAEMLYGVVALSNEFMAKVPYQTLPAPPHDEAMVWQIVDAAGHVLYRSHQAPAQAMLPAFAPGLHDGLLDYRVYAMALPTPDRMLYVGQLNKYRVTSRYESIALIGLSALLIGALCAVWMGWRIRQSLQPLSDLGQQVRNYDPFLAETTLPPASREEFVDIRKAILHFGNRSLHRIQNEQAFAAHAAHALRTPLAAMDLQLAGAARMVPDPYRERIQLARQAAQRLKRVIAGLLALFRSRTELNIQPVDLHEVVRHVQNGQETLHVQVEQPVQLWADPDLLAGVLANLFENSLRYGADQCHITLVADADWQTLTVSDNGPGVPQDKREALEQVANNPDSEGFVGLGLKLATLFAKSHKGHMRLGSPPAGATGFVVEFSLPVRRPTPREVVPPG